MSIAAPPLTPGRAAAITAQFLFYQFGIGVFVGVLPQMAAVFREGTPPFEFPLIWTLIIANSLATLGIFYGESRRLKTSWRSWPPARVSFAWLLLPTLFVAFGNLVLVEPPSRLISFLIPPPEHMDALLLELFDLVNHPFAVPFALVVMAPLTEETIFRGHILRGLLHTTPPAKAILISAALFSILHLDPWQMPPTFMVGLALGWVYYRTGSVLLCIAGHALHNGIVLMFAVHAINTIGTEPTPPFPLWVYLLGATSLALGLFLVARLTTKPAPLVPPPLPN